MISLIHIEKKLILFEDLDTYHIVFIDRYQEVLFLCILVCLFACIRVVP